MFVWIEWQTVNGARCTCISSCHVYWCWCLRTHFSNIFSIFHVTCSFCTMPLSNATKLNHPRHLHLNTITSRWQCIFFVFFFPMNLRSPTLSVHNLHVHSSIYTYSSNPSILLPLVTSVLPYRTLNSPYAVCVCLCAASLRRNEKPNYYCCAPWFLETEHESQECCFCHNVRISSGFEGTFVCMFICRKCIMKHKWMFMFEFCLSMCFECSSFLLPIRKMPEVKQHEHLRVWKLPKD